MTCQKMYGYRLTLWTMHLDIESDYDILAILIELKGMFSHHWDICYEGKMQLLCNYTDFD